MSVVIIESGGNYASIQAAFKRLGICAEVTSEPKQIQDAQHVILPGVGAAGFAMQRLKEKKLIAVIKNLQQPVLGICLGQQLLCDYSQEDNTACLGIIPLQVKCLQQAVLPHMGWNSLICKADPLLKGILPQDDFYFVHSFAPELGNYTIAITMDFSAVIKKDNFYGVQFHPEKSGEVGGKTFGELYTLMKIIPSIDIQNGLCVRLAQGDFNRSTIYHPDPKVVANWFKEQGVKALHVVDLDGAKNGKLTNLSTIAKIIKAFDGEVQVGGGIRTEEDIDQLFNLGASRVVIGTRAILSISQMQQWIKKYGEERVVLALDFRIENNVPQIAIAGWQQNTALNVWTVLEKFKLKYVLCTDISKDGMQQGPNMPFYAEFKQRYPELFLQASGGIGTVTEINQLITFKVDAAIIGKAIYESKNYSLFGCA